MDLDRKTLYNICHVFFQYFKDTDLEDKCLSVLKIFDISYNKRIDRICYIGQKSFMLSKEDTIRQQDLITPLKLKHFDLDCIETVLNSSDIAPYANKLSPLFDALGWVLRYEVDRHCIHFIGGADYEVWNEPMVPWDYDLDKSQLDWKSGDDWRDGFNLDKELPIDWKSQT